MSQVLDTRQIRPRNTAPSLVRECKRSRGFLPACWIDGNSKADCLACPLRHFDALDGDVPSLPEFQRTLELSPMLIN